MAKKSFAIRSSKTARVDRENGIIYNISIIRKGEDKIGDYIDDEFIEGLVASANKKSKGVKSRLGHPTACGNDPIDSYLGAYKNFRTTPKGVVADLYLSKTAKNTPRGNLYDYVLDRAEENPEHFGNSIEFMCDSEPMQIKGKDVNRLIFKDILGSDLVDSPCATENLFKSTSDRGIIISEMIGEDPELLVDLFDIIANPSGALEAVKKSTNETIRNYIAQDPELLDVLSNEKLVRRFAVKIEEFSKQKKLEMATKRTAKRQPVKAKDIRYSIDGELYQNDELVSEIVVVTEAEEPAVGDAVNVVTAEGEAPAPDDTYPTTDGVSIVVQDGVIVEVISTEVTEDDAAEGEGNFEEMSKNFVPIAKYKSLLERVERVEKSMRAIAAQNARSKSTGLNFVQKSAIDKDEPKKPTFASKAMAAKIK